jgi:pentatricopeptide repeat protein
MYAAVRGGQSSKAFEILDNMRSANVMPNTFTYDTLLKAHGASGELIKMDNLFADIYVKSKKASESFLSSIALGKNVKPSTATFTTLIDAHGTTGNIEGMMHIYRNMMPQYSVKSDIHVYNALIRWCCQYGQIATAKKIFFDMESTGIKPNVVTFNYLVRHEALKQGRAGAAYQIIQLMQRIYNVRPLQSMYNAIIKVHMKHRRPEEAKEVFREWQTGQQMVRLPTSRD